MIANHAAIASEIVSNLSMKLVLPASTAKALAILLTLFAALSLPLRAQVFINEVMADNQSALLNEGIYPDWVELYNPTTNPVDLSDWSMSDSISTPRKYIFRAGTTIPA